LLKPDLSNSSMTNGQFCFVLIRQMTTSKCIWSRCTWPWGYTQNGFYLSTEWKNEFRPHI